MATTFISPGVFVVDPPSQTRYGGTWYPTAREWSNLYWADYEFFIRGGFYSSSIRQGNSSVRQLILHIIDKHCK